MIQIPLNMARGYVLWEGKSMLTGGPIIAILTGTKGTTNAKTGQMLQTWIMCRDAPPGEARRTGKDEDVCGDCLFRMHGGIGGCYVGMWGPASVWRAWKAGGYPPLDDLVRSYIRGALHVRIGAYGDPVSVPLEVWNRILPTGIRRSTGYTSSWRLPQASAYKRFLMASTKSPAETSEARAKGWRTFEVLPRNRPVPDDTIWCPSDKLNPSGSIPCERCGVCSGCRGGKSHVSIYVHGSGAATFGARRQRLPSTTPIKRDGYGDLPLVRMDPEIHAKLKRLSKKSGKPMRRIVEELLVNSGVLGE